ncbi:MAG: ribosome biogenesis GTPase YlqF [Acutalibacteraceae bacterium]|jgi:ribosome biogenesis GTPase A
MNDFQKQNVQWFPGHMAKTRRLIKASLPMVDLVAEILDARVPKSSRNPELLNLIGTKPRIVLLNKSDLADDNVTKLWVEHYAAKGVSAIPVNCSSGKGVNRFAPLVRRELGEVIAANKAKGMVGKPLSVMVVGIPNTGKSTFINRMAGKVKAKAADKPGVTRQNQWFDIGDGIRLLDTPGMLWPKFEDPEAGKKLAFIGSVKDEILDVEWLALHLLKVLKTAYPERIAGRYGVEDPQQSTEHDLLEAVARRRGMLLGGGETDTLRAAVTLLDEFRGGKLGKITLERP